MGVREGSSGPVPGPDQLQALRRLLFRQRPEGRGDGDRARLQRRHRRLPLRLLLVQRRENPGGGDRAGLPQGEEPRQDEVRAHVVLPRPEEILLAQEVRRRVDVLHAARAQAGGVPGAHRLLDRALLQPARALAAQRQDILLHLQCMGHDQGLRRGGDEVCVAGGAPPGQGRRPRRNRVQRPEPLEPDDDRDGRALRIRFAHVLRLQHLQPAQPSAALRRRRAAV